MGATLGHAGFAVRVVRKHRELVGALAKPAMEKPDD